MRCYSDVIGLAVAATAALWPVPGPAQEPSTAHLSAAQLEVQAGIKMVHVPYRGAQPALTDVLAGHVDMFFDTLATSVPLKEAGIEPQ